MEFLNFFFKKKTASPRRADDLFFSFGNLWQTSMTLFARSEYSFIYPGSILNTSSRYWEYRIRDARTTIKADS